MYINISLSPRSYCLMCIFTIVCTSCANTYVVGVPTYQNNSFARGDAAIVKQQVALLNAINIGDTFAAIALLDSGASPNLVVNVAGRPMSPMDVAIRRHSMACVGLLVDHGADPTAALWRACAFGDEALISFLLVHGADINHMFPHEETALYVAAARVRPQIVAFLLGHGADAATVFDYGDNENILHRYESLIQRLSRMFGQHATPPSQRDIDQQAILDMISEALNK